jgi:hypothetical protein
MASANLLQFYLNQAERAGDDAEAATLSNVRERCRRSESAWNQLAQQAALAERNRLTQSIMKAASPPSEQCLESSKN